MTTSPASRAVNRLRELYGAVFGRMRQHEARLAHPLAGRHRFRGMERLEPRVLLSGTHFIVDSLTDVVASDGVVTLREAILAANTNTAVTADVPAGSSTDGDRITFNRAALQADVGRPLRITLSGTELEITGVLELTGLGTDVLTLDAAGLSRVFYVSGSQTQVSLSDLTITGGNSASDDGGGICNYGTLELSNVTVSGNSASGTDSCGGGICNFEGVLTLSNVTVSGNSASYGGGGIFNYDGVLTLANVTVSGNSASGYSSSYGGGIDNWNGTLTLNNSIVALNRATNYPNLSGTFLGSHNLIGSDPGFVRNPSAGADGVWDTADDDDGNLRLLQTSPAVNAGDNALLPADAYDLDGDGNTTEQLPIDLAGNPRIIGGIVDIGAYETSLSLSGTHFIVNSLADVVDSDGVVTLREALRAANTNTAVTADVPAGSSTDGDRITFDLAALQAQAGAGNPLRITLSGTALSITGVLELTGLGADVLTLDAAGNSRVLAISGGSTQVSLSDLTITGGNSALYDGGGIYNHSGTLTLANVTVSDNSASEDGGGIFNYDGTLTLANVTVSDNSASGSGGGISNDDGALTLSNVTVSGNSASDDGGGIYNDDGALTMSNVTVSGNSASLGGGIYNSGTLTLANVTVNGNSASLGGGICNRYGRLTLANVTVSGNSASYDGGGIHNVSGALTLANVTVSGNSAFFGGGIFNEDGTLTLANVTVSGNSAYYRGGGIDNEYGMLTLSNVTVSGNSASATENSYGGGIINSGTLTLANVTVSGNSASWGGGIINSGVLTLANVTVSGNSASESDGGIWNSSGTLTLNNSIVALNRGDVDLAGTFLGSHNLIGSDPGFVRNPSAGADGVWDTADDDDGDLRLLPSSLAVDAGDNALLPADGCDLDGDGDTTEPLPVDLDGKPRIIGGIVDIGAYETSAILDRHLFFNNSLLDGHDPAANTLDDDAIAADRQALMPGGLPCGENCTGYSKGLNGLMVDIGGLADPAGLTLATLGNYFGFMVGSANDPLSWITVPAPAQVSVRAGEGESSPDRVTVIWADNAIENTWLQVTVKAGAATGLAADDVFCFGHLAGDATGDAIVDIVDLATVANSWQQSPNSISGGDFNLDGIVDIVDLAMVANNWQKSALAPLTAESLTAAATAAGAPVALAAPSTEEVDSITLATAAAPLVDDAPVMPPAKHYAVRARLYRGLCTGTMKVRDYSDKKACAGRMCFTQEPDTGRSRPTAWSLAVVCKPGYLVSCVVPT